MKLKRLYDNRSVDELMSIVAFAHHSMFSEMTLNRTEITAELSDQVEFDAADNLSSVMSLRDVETIPSSSPAAVIHLVWRFCDSQKLRPFRMYVDCAETARALTVTGAPPRFFGIPVYQSEKLEPSEFVVLLAPTYYGPIDTVRKVISGIVNS
jgi:hypothetical protein